jgi:hypothetical protein
MANLSFSDKKRLEAFLNMGGGYVLNFSNNTLQKFVHDAIGIDIYNPKYDYGTSTSKANRIRGVWEKESDYQVGLLIDSFIKYWNEFIAGNEISNDEYKSLQSCEEIAKRLKSESLVGQIDALQAVSEDINFHKLAKQIREAIEKNEPESALDRLHTYTVKFIRKLCDKHGIVYDKDKPLHSFFGEYVKHLKKNDLIKSVMTERILKSAISTLEAFNDVRNNQSLAHDNTLLNYDESLLIFKNISSIVEFINSIEEPSAKPAEIEPKEDELPF